MENRLEEAMEFARKELHSKSCGDGKIFHRYETLYGLAYQKLVVAELRPKLRVKMRPR